MAGSLNKVMLIGRLGADPELRTTPNGNQVVNFNLATDESYKDKNGQRVERTEWHRIVVWDKLAEICKQYLSKGRLVYIEGRLTTRSWEDKETGKKHYMTEVVATDMQMLESKTPDPSTPPGEVHDNEIATKASAPKASATSAPPKAAAPKPQPAPEPAADPKNDDLPF